MARRTNSPLVLLVQPPGDNLQMYVEFLASRQVDCIAATNATDALLAAPQVDVVVTGILLPGSDDGLELIRRLRADDRTKAIPIIVLTAWVLDSTRERAEAAGCDLFLSKPCLPEDLLAEILRVSAARRLRMARRRTSRPTSSGRKIESQRKVE